MGNLDEPTFAAHLAPCPACGGTRLEIASFIDQRVPVMLAEAAGAGRWVHDGEKFVDGTYRIACAGCKHVVFASDVCPRCNTPGGLGAATRTATRLPVPRTCPSCDATELSVTALTTSTTLHTGGRAQPRATAELGDPGFHVTSIDCDDCGEVASAGDACPLCGAAGPVRARP